MDTEGRLHMPGFVGMTYKENGLKDPEDEIARQAVEGAELHGAIELGANRRSRRKIATELRHKERVG
jgi:hypothetical protein